ncbi:conserved hypothetical protein [Talaromyces stipitatus ATCC 10500]|uniref:HTH CENPB-type domain-containing protein n=1 Tax=Talaromyces stipitatus (strain ATCC 10500 / CBS 375.48 / QM 6759 / NRRL 1006) TaxID=441959 RepID=B8MU96_TALSN|nr:uncharacterized protein TSTA_107910 [Talaromyces stipitatus ATCC 10500]EED11600.1 conserved hypothetical protein [Talaromyces stipitatus ATCC 10500]
MAYRAETRANSHKLSKSEEESLVKWILDLDKRGLPPRHSLVREMADYLLSQRGNQQVGEKWVYNLIRRRPEIESKFSRKYNYERAKCEDPKIIQEYFDRVREVVSEHGILQEDIYNFDETGFAMGLCATAKVITGSDRYARPKLLQPVNSIGWALPSYIIFKAKKYTRLGWFEDLPDDWKINISDNGWTTDKIGLEWLKTHFIPLTDGRTLGKYRMLILDGHGSHLTAEFDRTCTENNIIPPLDVGCFAVLKRHYGQLVEQRTRLGFNHIDKIDFLTAFPKARTMAYKAQTVRNSFIATGLKELHNLRAAHEKEKQKRRRSKQQISHEQGITREEAQALVQGQIEVSQAVTTAPAEPELPVSHPPVRRQFRCSGCGVAGHKITGCPNRIST